MAQGKIQKGAIPVELAVPDEYFIEELAKRGIIVSVEINS